MQIVALTIGILVAIGVIVHFKKTRLENSKFAYALLLITFPFYYFAFAIYGNDYKALALEFSGGSLFWIVGFCALKSKDSFKFSLLAFGYSCHALYDVTHNRLFLNAGTPTWWPEFCGAVDLIIGLYLASLALKYRVRLG